MSKIEDKYYLPWCLSYNYDFTDKKRCADNHIKYMLSRTQSMFKYDGLPETITQRVLELMLQTNGHVCITDVNGDLYVFTGGLGGEPDIEYQPTIYTVANPHLKTSRNLRINKDCVVIKNDSMYMGLLPLFNRYATALVENEISMNISTINSRIAAIISAPDDNTKIAAETFLKEIADGKTGIIGENAFLDGIRVQPLGNTTQSNALTSLIEYEQYLRAGWFNEIGLNANYNMKRESINSGESQLNNDMLMPFIDDMLRCRETALEKINEMYGTNITVSLYSAWEDNEKEIEIALSDEPQDEPDETNGGGENES